MGKFFIDASDTVRIDFPDKEWVIIKEELTQADQDYLNKQMVGVKATQIVKQVAAAAAKGDSKPDIEINENDLGFDTGRTNLLVRGIIDWSFVDDHDNKVPINAQTCSTLRLKYRQVILDKLDEQMAVARKFEKKS